MAAFDSQHDQEVIEEPPLSGYGSAYGYGCSLRPPEIRQALQPLVEQVHSYDKLRLKLETQGGRVEDLNTVAGILTEEIHLEGCYRPHTVSLTDQSSVRRALIDIGSCDLHMDVRRLDTSMPVYYICRIREDYWSAYSLIVEDIYRSPGYPTTDDRLVRLMDFGHEKYHLRLSQFRQSVAATAQDSGYASERRIDDLLYDVGRHVFQAAWHEDQRPGMLAADHFDLPQFRHAIELLYLCLSAELCELRSAINERMLRFFDQVYPQPAIRDFLEMLTGLDGTALNEIPQNALKLYAELSRAFGRLIELQVTWGARQVQVPLYKLLFGNISRLGQVAAALKENKELAGATAKIEKEAKRVIDRIQSHRRSAKK